MSKRALYRICIVIAFAIMGISDAYGAHEHWTNSINGKHFAADSSVITMDDKYGGPLWSTIQKNISVINVVTLQLDEDTIQYLGASHSCRVDLEITYYDSAGHADSLTTTLAIKYDSTRSKRFNFRSSFKFNGGYKVKARILAVFYDGTLTTHFPKVFDLGVDIYVNRVYTFSCSTPMTPTDSLRTLSQRLVMSWLPYTGADEYDLEYTMYDDSSQVIRKDTMNSYSDLGFLFNGNATRVTTCDKDYEISLVYNPGYIFYRVRPIHYDQFGNRIEGTWSSYISSTIHAFTNKFHWKGHENTMNWQYTAAFAEQGRRKEVAGYYDGTLRNRQNVTMNNTQNKAIVGETIYDYEGRPAVTTLPAPIDTGKLWFYNKFNHNSADSEYHAVNFDTGECEQYIPQGMDSARGSSRYYSKSNPDTTSGFGKLLPDAQGYPFTMTEYTPDMTGRISRQSIAGKTHRFGSGRETKFFYGKPAQEELDRLFGNEVGDYSHYMKNMQIDANGQINVSYLNESGKVIATALAGKLPPNLKPIGSYTTATSLNVNLLDTTGNIRQNTSISSTYVLLAIDSARYYFTYKLFPGNYTDTSCGGAHVCTDCLYDVQLAITGGCEGTMPLILHYDSNFSYASAFDTTCGHQNIVDTFSVVLGPGNYTVTRLITVDPQAINYYTARFQKKATCLKTYSTFLNNAIINTDFSGCNMNCATCLSTLGDTTAFVHKYITQLHNAGESVSTHQDTLDADTAWAHAYVQCNTLCASTSPCTGLYDEILADVSLGGQYCTYTISGSTYSPGDAASVLNSDYKSPSSPYVNSSGAKDSVLINGVQILPQNLTLAQFIQNWKPSWASSLVTYHPEYCFYTRCVSDSASNRYDNAMESTPDYATACSKGYLAPFEYTQIGYTGACSGSVVKRDPYFKTGGYGASATSDTNWMKKRLDKYVSFTSGGSSVTLSLWATSAVMAICSADTLGGGSGLASCYSSSDTTIGGGCAGNMNMEWVFFRNLYLSLKQHMQDSLDSVYVLGAGCDYADCIGISGCGPSGVYASKTPRHISLQYASTKHLGATSPSLATERTYVDSAMTANCDSTCISYAYNWYHKLDSCGAILHADSARLIRRLILVCEAGCNFSHPQGASTTPYATPDDSGDVSFEDVIHNVLGKNYSNALCNGALLTMPPPYFDSTGVSGPATTYYKPTPCQCGNIDSAYNIYHADSLTTEPLYKNFGDFLTKYYGDTITEATAWAIKSLCGGSCFFATTPVQMPLWMSCCQDSNKPQQVTVAGGGWTKKAYLGISGTFKPLFDAASFVLADSGYVVDGDSANTSANTLWRWDQSSNTWAIRQADEPRQGGIGFAIAGMGYTGLGYKLSTSTYRKDLRKYNPSTNSWSNMTSFPDTTRNNAFCFVINDSAYVGCGDSNSAFFTHVWKYDAGTNTWAQRTRFPGGRRAAMASFSIGKYGYVGCGFDNLGHLHNDMWKFNSSNNTWTSIAPLPVKVMAPISFTINGKGYVGTGYVGNNAYDSNSYIRQFWQYDTTANKWYSVTPFSGSRSAFGVGFSIGNYGYVGTGTNQLDGTYSNTTLADFGQFSISGDSLQFASPECCILCANMDTGVVHFNKVYPSLKDTNANYPAMFAGYLNQYFGFNMTYNEYREFQIACESARTNTIHLHDGTNLPLTLCNRTVGQPLTGVDTNSCYNQLMTEAQNNATMQYNTYVDSVQNAFKANYIAHCMQIGDSFHVLEPFDEYHYTLFYIDQAGNLVKTVPPEGVHPITLNATNDTAIVHYRKNLASNGVQYPTATPVYPVDSFQTHYFYNTLNEPIKRQTPDGDSVHIWYDRISRPVLIQNAIQRPLTYSYISYDALGRVIEVGQLSGVPAVLPSCFHCVGCTINYGVLPVLPDTFTRNDIELKAFINNSTRTQVIHTYYDSVTYPNIPLSQQNLRNRIASVTYEEHNDYNIKTYDNAIHYSFDHLGNVSIILIDVPHDSIVKQRYKRINYYYDLISGNVNELAYEQDSIDQFIHSYDYDADNRLVSVETSRDSLFWENDASYEYYDHGPLAREVIGRRQVQGLDFMYTLNGWLKGVNSGILNPSFDMGHDGDVHGSNATIGRDAFGYTLNYYNGDYRAIGASNFEATGLPITSLYNGNIAGSTYSIQPLTPSTIGYTYNYDQLNRYVGDSVFKNPGTNSWSTRTGINDFKEKVSYDENGNILLYLRHGNTAVGPLAMDSLTYHYTKGKDQLAQVNDAVPSTNYTVDIHNETSKRNYQYNGIGQLAKDSAGGLDTITWTIYGKLKKIIKHNGDSIVLFYDPLGNRLEKRNYPHGATSDTIIYSIAADGNILAIYDRKKDTVRLTEWDIYGNRRLGSLDTVMRIYPKPASHSGGTIDSSTVVYLEGQRQYELDNHLDNVLVTVSDKKIPVDTNSDGIADYYLPNIISAQDYYTGGMIEVGRQYAILGDSIYNFGYQGSMKDNNIYGAGNAYTTKNRELDDRLNRWWSPDRVTHPDQSPYLTMGDNPIFENDETGDDPPGGTAHMRHKPHQSKHFEGSWLAHTFGFLSAKYTHAHKFGGGKPETDGIASTNPSTTNQTTPVGGTPPPMPSSTPADNTTPSTSPPPVNPAQNSTPIVQPNTSTTPTTTPPPNQAQPPPVNINMQQPFNPNNTTFSNPAQANGQLRRAGAAVVANPNAAQVIIIVSTNLPQNNGPINVVGAQNVPLNQFMWNRGTAIMNALIRQGVPASSFGNNWLQINYSAPAPGVRIQIR